MKAKKMVWEKKESSLAETPAIVCVKKIEARPGERGADLSSKRVPSEQYGESLARGT